ncbi:MAG: LacI family DNA-binding transcriptional regulator [Clostridiaceae bacterium]
MSDHKRPTIRDVAREAHVSIATVSRAISNSDYPMNDALRERVRSAASEMGYHPSVAAQMLRQDANRDICLIVPNISNPYYLQALRGINAVVSENDYMFVLCNTERQAQREHEYLRQLYQRQCLGAIISSVDTNPDTINQYVEKGMKIVLLDQQLRGAKCPTIRFDSRGSGELATNYLIGLGHRKIAFATMPLSRWTRQEIYHGYQDALINSSITPDDSFLFVADPPNDSYGGDIELTAGANIAADFLAGQCDATAILCINDMVAFGVLQTLLQNGVRVPDDISVMGFDDVPFAGVYSPALTTIRYPSEQTGRFAAMMLLDSISSNKGLDTIEMQLNPQLVVRQSTRKI